MEKYFGKTVKLKNHLVGKVCGYFQNTKKLVFGFSDLFGRNQYIKIDENDIVEIL